MYANVPGAGAQIGGASASGANSSIAQTQMYDGAPSQRHDYRATPGAIGSNISGGHTASGSNSSALAQQQNSSVASNQSSLVTNPSAINARPQSTASNAALSSGSVARGSAPSTGADAASVESKRDDLGNASANSTLGQLQPPGIRPRVTTTMWEDEKTLCYQVDANNVSVVRRADNNMINGTKLLNVAQMTRGRRDGILKLEKMRHVVKIGSMHLKGVWIPFDRALAMAQREGIVDMLYPLFVRDIKRMIQTGVTPASHPSTTTNAASSSAAATGKGSSIASGGGYPSISNNSSGVAASNGSFYPQQYSSQYPSASGNASNSVSAPSGNDGASVGTQVGQQLQQSSQQGQQTLQSQQQPQQQVQMPSQLYGYSQPYYNQYYSQYNQGAPGNNNGLNAAAGYSSYSQEPFANYSGYQAAQGAAIAPGSGQKSSFDHGQNVSKGLAKQQGSPAQKDKEGEIKAKV